MEYQLTAVYHRVAESFIGFVEELPGANSQGATLEETRANLREAVELVIEANRALSVQDLAGATVIREPLKVTA
jgi:predicted RNase H-like HicB family nuclease